MFSNNINELSNKNNETNEKRIIFDINDLNLLCGHIKPETKLINEDITSLTNSIGNYKEKIKEALNYVNSSNHLNASAQRHNLMNLNVKISNFPISNLTSNLANSGNSQNSLVISNNNINNNNNLSD